MPLNGRDKLREVSISELYDWRYQLKIGSNFRRSVGVEPIDRRKKVSVGTELNNSKDRRKPI